MSFEFEAPVSITNTLSLISRSFPNLNTNKTVITWKIPEHILYPKYLVVYELRPVSDFLQQCPLFVIAEVSRESSGDVSEVSVSCHKNNSKRLLDPTPEN